MEMRAGGGDPDAAYWIGWTLKEPTTITNQIETELEMGQMQSIIESIHPDSGVEAASSALRESIFGHRRMEEAGSGRWDSGTKRPERVRVWVNDDDGAIWFVTPDGYPYGMVNGYRFSDIPALIYQGKVVSLDEDAIARLEPRAIRRMVRLVLAIMPAIRKGATLNVFFPFRAVVTGRGWRGRTLAFSVGLDEIVVREV